MSNKSEFILYAEQNTYFRFFSYDMSKALTLTNKEGSVNVSAINPNGCLPFNNFRMTCTGNNISRIIDEEIEFYLQRDTIFLALFYKYIISRETRLIQIIEPNIKISNPVQGTTYFDSFFRDKTYTNDLNVFVSNFASIINSNKKSLYLLLAAFEPSALQIVKDIRTSISKTLKTLKLNFDLSINGTHNFLDYYILSKEWKVPITICFKSKFNQLSYKIINICPINIRDLHIPLSENELRFMKVEQYVQKFKDRVQNIDIKKYNNSIKDTLHVYLTPLHDDYFLYKINYKQDAAGLYYVQNIDKEFTVTLSDDVEKFLAENLDIKASLLYLYEQLILQMGV
jgi:hypothetical protein